MIAMRLTMDSKSSARFPCAFACARVRECECVCVRECVCVCVCACVLVCLREKVSASVYRGCACAKKIPP
jgi:hypothetical protein